MSHPLDSSPFTDGRETGMSDVPRETALRLELVRRGSATAPRSCRVEATEPGAASGC